MSAAPASRGRVLSFAACVNARDLGGVPTRSGATPFRAVVRSDSLAKLTAEGRRELLAYGVRTVVDLRHADEIEKEAHPFQAGGPDGVRYVRERLESVAARALMRRVESGEVADALIVDLSRANVARVVTAIARAGDGSVLFHCQAGKDRSGILAALLLAFAGAPRDAIVDDYMLSDDGLRPSYETWIANAAPHDRERVRNLVECRPERPAALLAHLERRYGGAEAYLRAAGVADEDLARLRERLGA